MKVCMNCYTENPLDAVLCSECGMGLTRAATGEEAVKLRELGVRLEAERREEARRQLEQLPIGETPSGQSLLAYRLAAVLLFVGVFLNILDALLAGGGDIATYIVRIGIDLVLAVGLLRLSSRARFWVLVRAVFGAILWPIFAFLTNDPFTAVLMSLMQWGYCGALLLLLTGQSKTWRLVLALAIFAVPTLGIYGLALLSIALAFLLGVPVG